MPERVGFVGLGNMGLPMARRLAAAGHALTVFDLRGNRVDALLMAAGGATAAESLADVGRQSDIVITMLPDGLAVRAAVIGPGGAAETLKPGSLVVDMSTANPTHTQALGRALSARGIDCIDAPVAGGVSGAEAGTLTVTAGGRSDRLAELQPIFAAIAGDVFHCGPLGSGHAMKAINNFVNASALVSAIEGLVLAARYGVDLKTAMHSMSLATTGANHPLPKKVEAHILTRRFASGMPLGLLAKDLGIAKALAAELDVEAPCIRAMLEVWETAKARLGPDIDQTAISRLWEEQAGVVLERRG